MIRLPAFGVRRAATVMVVLAALFHVQWLAACDLAPAADHGQCCVEGQSGGMDHCGDGTVVGDCQLSLLKSHVSLKTPERLTVADDLPDAFPWTGFPPARALRLPARPPNATQYAVTPDGRSLYLTSSRLRL